MGGEVKVVGPVNGTRFGHTEEQTAAFIQYVGSREAEQGGASGERGYEGDRTDASKQTSCAGG